MPLNHHVPMVFLWFSYGLNQQFKRNQTPAVARRHSATALKLRKEKPGLGRGNITHVEAKNHEDFPLTHMLHGAGIFINIGPQNHPNVVKYTIHGAYGI